MKRKILITTVLLLAVTMLFALINTVKAAEVSEAGAFVKVVDSTGTKYYADLNEALTAAQTGATVTLLKDINSGNIGDNDGTYHRVAINGPKTLTFDFNKHTITSDSLLPAEAAAFVVRGGAIVTFEGEGGITNNNIGGALLVTTGSKAVLNGGTYVTKGTREDGIEYSTVTVLDSTVEVNNGAILKNENGKPALQLENTTATLNGGTISQTGTPNDNKNYNAIQSSKGELTVKGGTIKSEKGSGIGLFGNGPKLTITGGTITAQGFAVAGNGSTDPVNGTQNSTITISGGTLKSTDTAAIYHPESGTLTINDGAVIEGYFGIVSRQGTVNVKGGTITATGKENAPVGDATGVGGRVVLPVGAIVTDNKSEYGGGATPTTVAVTDGNINGAIVGYEDNDNDDINLTGGTFDEPIPARYIGNSLEVQKGDIYYLGDNAQDVLTNAKLGDKLTVINGNVNLNGVHNGVEVTNEGEGNVTLNGQKVEKTPVKVVNQTELIEDLKAEIEELEQKLNNGKIEPGKAREELNELKDRVNSLESENKELKDKVAELEAKVEKLEAEQQKAPESQKPETTEEGKSGELDDEPKTGDAYIISAGLVSLLSLVGAVVSKRFIK